MNKSLTSFRYSLSKERAAFFLITKGIDDGWLVEFIFIEWDFFVSELWKQTAEVSQACYTSEPISSSHVL